MGYKKYNTTLLYPLCQVGGVNTYKNEEQKESQNEMRRAQIYPKSSLESSLGVGVVVTVSHVREGVKCDCALELSVPNQLKAYFSRWFKGDFGTTNIDLYCRLARTGSPSRNPSKQKKRFTLVLIRRLQEIHELGQVNRDE
ncbi:hypothetical protein J6590_070428 [Homalodisca vitripennis]|nr:hypothetical protein J6590_070428 [Homalodisca vitripennis]